LDGFVSADLYHAQVLAQGYLPAVKATLYTAPAGKRVVVKSLICVNEDVSNHTINLYINSFSSRSISPFNMILGPGYKTGPPLIHTLYDGDLIEGDCDMASTVSFTIEGAVSE
jgi:hypothetical protein